MSVQLPAGAFNKLSDQNVVRLGQLLQQAKFDPKALQTQGIVLDATTIKWLSQLETGARKELGATLSDQESPASITKGEGDRLSRVGLFGKIDHNALLLTLNRVTYHRINGATSDHEKQIDGVHDFLKTTYNNPAIIEDITTVKSYFDKKSPNFDPTYHIDYYSAGDKIIAVNISWTAPLADGTRVSYSDYNTPIEAGIPAPFNAIDPVWLSRQFVNKMLEKQDVVMAESTRVGLDHYLQMGFTADPAPYEQMAVGPSKDLQVVLASKSGRTIDLHDLFKTYVANLGEAQHDPAVKARLTANLNARPESKFRITGLNTH